MLACPRVVSNGNGDKWVNLVSILEVEPIGLVEGLDRRSMKKRAESRMASGFGS